MNRFAELAWKALQEDDSKSKWKRFLGLSLVAGLFAIALRGYEPTVISASAILAGGSLFVGVVVGFLFGIPKTVQRKAEAAAAKSGVDYQSNTNLEEISDWLTKMLVGVGLVELREVPNFIGRIAEFWAPALGSAAAKPYAAGLVVYFSAVGFLIGYLWTRLELVGDFIERDPRRLIMQLLSRVAQIAQENPEATERSPSRQVVTPEELDAAKSLASLSASARVGTDELRRQIQALAAQYEATRASMDAGAERTRRMEVLASQMRTFSIAAYALLSDLVNSPSAGERLAAITFLQTRPNYSYLPWLAECLRVETPFVGYHAAVALQHAARAATIKQRSSVRDALEIALQYASDLPDSSDRIAVLRDAMAVTSSGV